MENQEGEHWVFTSRPLKKALFHIYPSDSNISFYKSHNYLIIRR